VLLKVRKHDRIRQHPVGLSEGHRVMMQRWAEPGASIRKSVLFWWILFVVIQMAERVFLLRDALDQETPTAPLLLKTFLVGVRGDFITATFALVLGGGSGPVSTRCYGRAWAVCVTLRVTFRSRFTPPSM
ncbi:MAG: hypothetical protein QM771_19280, partial [Nitrospira sp.]